MSTSLRLADLGRPPRVRIQNSDGDPLASGLAQVCDVAEALLQAQHRKLRKEGDRQTGERYRRRGEVVDAWRKKVMTRRDEHPLVVPLADLVANLQVAANKIWATPITEKLELPDQRHVCQVYLVPHTEYLSPTCKLADFAPAPELVDDDMEESRRAQTSDARIRAATDYEARIRTATNYCYKYVVQTAQQAGAANLLSACLARKEDYAVWRGHVVRWSRVEEQALTDHRAMHNLRSLSDKLWTTPLTEQIRFVISSVKAKFAERLSASVPPLSVQQQDDLPWHDDHDPRTCLNDPCNPFFPDTRHGDVHPAHTSAAEYDPRLEGPENCDPDELHNFIETSTVDPSFYHHRQLDQGSPQRPVVLLSQGNVGRGGERRR